MDIEGTKDGDTTTVANSISRTRWDEWDWMTLSCNISVGGWDCETSVD
jgi:hypothetical protein